MDIFFIILIVAILCLLIQFIILSFLSFKISKVIKEVEEDLNEISKDLLEDDNLLQEENSYSNSELMKFLELTNVDYSIYNQISKGERFYIKAKLETPQGLLEKSFKGKDLKNILIKLMEWSQFNQIKLAKENE